MKTVADRFWSKVDRSGGPAACWPWRAGCNIYGYGHFRLSKERVVRANRLAIVLGDPADVERPGGRIPPRKLGDGDLACHARACHDSGIGKACCNPAHLTPGDHSKNLKDCYEHGDRARAYEGGRRWDYKPSKALDVPGAA